LGITYNRTLRGTLEMADRLWRWPVELRAAAVGAAVGILAWFWPWIVGGGSNLTQQVLEQPQGLGLLAGVFVVRLALGAISYAARTPGGLFAPLLVLGAQSGLFFGMVADRWFPGLAIQPIAVAVVGMAAFFTAVVRSPL